MMKWNAVYIFLRSWMQAPNCLIASRLLQVKLDTCEVKIITFKGTVSQDLKKIFVGLCDVECVFFNEPLMVFTFFIAWLLCYLKTKFYLPSCKSILICQLY